MNIIGKLSISSCLVLAACGGGGTSQPEGTIPPLVAAGTFPANFTASSNETNVGAFQILFAQSDKDPTGNRRPDRAKVTAGVATVFSDANGQMTLVTPSGKRYFFEEEPTVTASADGREYTYKEKDGGTNSMLIRRHDNGSRYGQFILGTLGEPSRIRASYHYGFRTDPSVIVSAPTATYTNVNGGQLFLSDGRRIFAGTTSLTVDFANTRVDGDLANNFGDPTGGTATASNPFGSAMEAAVSVSNGRINNDGTVSGGTLSLSFVDYNTDPLSKNGTETGTMNGQFYGPNAENLAGTFNGSVAANQATAGASTLSFSGVFSGLKP